MSLTFNKKILYGKQYVDSKDISLVSKSLKENFITTGNYVKKFEEEIKKKFKSKYAISCINATAGLHLAFLSINLKKNDIVVMPAINFISAYRMATLLGAKVFLADVDPISGQMTPDTLISCVKKNRLSKIKLILTMYLGGYAENVVKFYKLKKKYQCYLIEDGCHALGSKYNNFISHSVGSCKHSDICVFSFHPVKPITTGEGGAITTNNKILANRILLLKNHGIIRKKFYWDYDIKELGFNYRLSDINCALGLSQLKKLSFFLKRRKQIYNLYQKKFYKFSKYLSVFKANQPQNSFHLILLSFNFKKLKYSKSHILSYLNKLNIFPQYHYKPIYRFSFYKKKQFFRGAEFFYKNTISLPVYHQLTKQKQEKIIKNIFKYLDKFKK